MTRISPRPSPLEGAAARWRFPILSILAVGALLAENLVDFPLGVQAMRRLAGGLSLLDMRPWYDPQAVSQLFTALGGNGRSAYLHLLWTVDLILPFLFAAFLREAIRGGRFARLSFVPVAAAVCDYAENVAITVLLLQYPRTSALVFLGATFTLLKWIGYVSSILLSLAGRLRQSD